MASLKKRNGRYYPQYYAGHVQKRIALGTDSYRLAKEKLRRLESALASGQDNPLPTKTTVADVVTKYVQHIRTIKTPKSAQTDVYYLREVFVHYALAALRAVLLSDGTSAAILGRAEEDGRVKVLRHGQWSQGTHRHEAKE